MRINLIRIKVNNKNKSETSHRKLCEPEDNEATLSKYLKKKINLNSFTYQKYTLVEPRWWHE